MAKLGYDEDGNLVGLNNYMVRRALGANTLNVESLCQHLNINKWSFFKPMHVNNYLDFLSEEVVRTARFGLNIPYFSIGEEGLGVRFSGEVEECREDTIWKYQELQYEEYTVGEPVAVLPHYGRPCGDALNGYLIDGSTDNYSYLRLSDFIGYNHYAEKTIAIEKQDLNIDDLGFYYSVLTFSDTDGGLTVDNFNPLFGVLDNTDSNMNMWYAQFVVFGDSTNNGRYGVLNNIGTAISLAEEKKLGIDISSKIFNHLMGTWYMGIVLTPERIEYAKGDISFDVDAATKAIAYPIVTNNNIMGVLVENAVWKFDFPDGANIVLWENKFDNNPTTKPDKYYYNDKLVSSLATSGRVSADGNTDAIYFETSLYGDRGFSIEVEEEYLHEIIRRRFRRITLSNPDGNASGFDDINGYLVYDTNTDPVVTRYKPLLRGVSMIDTETTLLASNTCDFYMVFYFTNGEKYQKIVMQHDNIEHVILDTQSLYNTYGTDCYIGGITWENIVDIYTNKREGLRMNVTVKSDNNSTTYNVEISTANEENYDNVSLIVDNLCPYIQEDYSIACYLPSNLEGELFNGGGIFVKYSVESLDYN